MGAYLIAHITVKDPEQWRIYVDSVGETLRPHGGKVLFRGDDAQVLAGEHRHEAVAVLSFPDRAAIRQWHDSQAYQSLVRTRNQAADVVLISYKA